MTELTINPLARDFGAAVTGLNLNEIDDAGIVRLEALLCEHRVLVLPEQHLTDEALVSVSRKLGPLDVPAPNPVGEPFHKEHPEINVISNLVQDGKPAGNLGAGEAVWHADMTYQDTPPRAAILHALEVPAEGGNTYFADMYAAYETLPDEVKAHIEDKVAIHDAAHNSAGMLRKGYEEITDVRNTPGARHKLVRVDKRTGRRALFLGRRPHSYICGLPVAESEALLDRLWAHASRPGFAIAHRWRTGDALMWGNLEALHRRDAFDPQTRRRMHRTQIRTFWSEQAAVGSAA